MRAIILIAVLFTYYRQRIRTRQRKTCGRQCPEVVVGGVQTQSSTDLRALHPLNILVWQYAWSIAIQRNSSKLWCPEFLGFHYIDSTDWLIAHMVELSSHSPLSNLGWYHMAKEAITNYFISIYFQMWSKGFTMNNRLSYHSDSQHYLPGVRDKGRTSLWVRPTSLLHRSQRRDTQQLCLGSFLGAEGSKQLYPKFQGKTIIFSWDKSLDSL